MKLKILALMLPLSHGVYSQTIDNKKPDECFNYLQSNNLGIIARQTK
jgi:hypothetical protein